MKDAGVRGYLNSVLFLSVLVVALIFEFQWKVVERGVGFYLKWENHNRPQLGRIWEKDREAVIARNKVQSILSTRDHQERSAESIQSFNELFESLTSDFPQIVSRKKFLQLYSDFPGQWSRRLFPPYEMLEIDANKDWERVLLSRFGQWVTISFLDRKNLPLREIFLSTEKLRELQSTRTVKRGRLEEAGFVGKWIFSVHEFLQVLQTLDAATQNALFPDPKWFFTKDYRLTRVGIIENASFSGDPPPLLLGIEYETDFYTDVLIIPVPREVTNNILSEIETADADFRETFSEDPPIAEGELN